jgi:ectoine hydroxylase-related dioxygenase (phytanoyl-CoA dioxygenase family)
LGWALSPDERARYLADGFFVREAVFGASELSELRAAVERVHARICAAAGQAGAPPVERIDGKRYQVLLGSTVKWEWRESAVEIRSMEPCLHLDARLEGLVDEPRLVEPAAGLLGQAQLSLFTDKLNFKRPGGAPFPWHQDSPYWAFGCAHLERLASLQLYLDDADETNGCLWMIRASHRHGLLPVYADRGTLGRLYTDVDRVPGGERVPLAAPAGSLIFFHGDVVHGSMGNRSAVNRRALVLTYQPAGHPRWNRSDVRDVRRAGRAASAAGAGGSAPPARTRPRARRRA